MASACWAGEIVIVVTSATELARGVKCEPAPARADLEHVHPGPEPGALGHDPVLRPLGVAERLVGRCEDRARVGHRLVEEQAVEVVAEVVVALDVAARLADRVAPAAMREGPRRCWSGRRHQPRVKRKRVAVEGRELEQGGQVRARPQAVHVGLAGPRLAAQEHPQDAALVVDPDLGLRTADAGRRRPARLPSGRTIASSPTRIRWAAREHDPARDPVDSRERGDADAAALDGLAAHRVASWGCGWGSVGRPPDGRAASPCRWNRAPRSQSRSACQWISPIVRWVTSGWRSSIRSRDRSVSGRRAQDEARREDRLTVLALVDRDRQAVRVVADVDL